MTLMRVDARPDKGGWHYGAGWAEFRVCDRARGGCGHTFIGDRQAWQCAECAYGDHEVKR